MARSLKRRKFVDIEELQAKEEAYGTRLSKGNVLGVIAPYALSVGAFSFLLYWRISVTIVLVLLVSLITYNVVLPQEVKVRYYRRGLTQRNRCINVMTQAITNPDNTAYTCLKMAAERVEGEFQQDLQKLIAVLLTSENQHDMHVQFEIIQHKYQDDVIFSQFFEQVETFNNEGTRNIQTFKNLKEYHNQLFDTQKDYITLRKQRRSEVITITSIVFILCLTLAFANGIKNYVQVFAHSIVGMIASTLFLLIYAKILSSFIKYYYDESITTIG